MARLVKRVGGLETAAAARARSAKPEGWAICWVEDEELVDGAGLEPDQFVAVDVTIVERVAAGESEAGAAIAGTPLVRIRERATSNARDLGKVYDGDGVVIGRVISTAPGLVEYEALGERVSLRGPGYVDPEGKGA